MLIAQQVPVKTSKVEFFFYFAAYCSLQKVVLFTFFIPSNNLNSSSLSFTRASRKIQRPSQIEKSDRQPPACKAGVITAILRDHSRSPENCPNSPTQEQCQSNFLSISYIFDVQKLIPLMSAGIGPAIFCV
ncbi:hypothetical protein Tcan_00234 [Toxocara canis]|uniref:Uncharacterized protein n=1 Tax=Toxocara canis TaxID=6265 RepID=A0A0B2VS28_TOXCA|nr:hypothetical protein Tcan_00234 [Toxocara canis]